MLTEKQIQGNKDEFLEIVGEIYREKADTEGLVEFLLNSDFFEAPASSKYHCNFKGGLCQHSLNVYKNLKALTSVYTPGAYTDETLIIISLFHDLSKTNFYTTYTKKFKNYSIKGKFTDEKGKYDWDEEEYYSVKDAKDRLLARDHEVNSCFLLQKYIPLTDEEAIAIMNHHGGWGLDAMKAGEVSAIYEKYTLAILLHMADLASVYIDERNE